MFYICINNFLKFNIMKKHSMSRKSYNQYQFLTILVLIIIMKTSLFAQTQWVKHPGNPVLDKGPASWDILAIGQPTVLYENDTIKMWYGGVGSDWKSRICYAWSLDGINWTKHSNPVMDVGGPGEWDRGWLDTPEILKDGSGYKMLYYGDTAWQSSEINSSIGIAYSLDGINWTKEVSNPVFVKGNPGDWDGTWVESPALFYDSIAGLYKMWYNGVDTSTWKIQIGLATSANAVTWTRHPSNPVLSNNYWGVYDDMWMGTPAVLHNGNHFELWYSSTSASSFNTGTMSFDTVNICFATSADGISWIKHASNPLFNTYTAPHNPSIDKGGPWAPDVIFIPATDTYMMFFEAEGGTSDYTISLATAQKDTLSQILEKNSIRATVFPNPFSTSTYVSFHREMKNATLSIIDTPGKIVRTYRNVCGSAFEIAKENIGAGIYLLIVEECGQILYRSRIIVN